MPSCDKSETFHLRKERPAVSYPILASHVEETPVNSSECIMLNPVYALHMLGMSGKYPAR